MSPPDAISELASLARSASLTGAAPPTTAEAIREFESYFAGALLRQTSRSELGGGLMDGGSAGRMYREMFFEELARTALRHTGLGLAESLAPEAPRAAAGPEAVAGTRELPR